MGKCNCTPLVIENHAVHKINCSAMTAQPDNIDSEVDQILDDIPGDWQIIFEAKENAHTAITNLIAQEANKAVVAELKKMGDSAADLEGKAINHYSKIHDRIQALTADKEQA